MKQLFPYCTLAALAVLVGLLARIAPARMPQALDGGDFLSVLLGDAKKDISNTMVHEADSYFHGGVEMDCHHGHDHYHDDHEHDHEHRPDHGDGQNAEGAFDPWRWINSHIRAPQIDRHLDGGKAVEMMPWFWVAVKADPHNVEAWSTAWYSALYVMKDSSLALRIASDGCWQNPASIELACNLGRTYLAGGTHDVEQAERMFRLVIEMAGKMEKLDDDDYLAFFYATGILAKLAENRKDAKDLQALLDAARHVNPGHPTTIFIAHALNEVKSAKGL